MKDLEYFLDLAYKLKIIDKKPDGFNLREEKDNLNTISINDLHDLLVIRGKEIGYQRALNEFEKKGYLEKIKLEKLRGTIFAGLLEDELKEKNYFKKGKKEDETDLF